MQRSDGLGYSDPLDLLRRFVATPLTSLFGVGSVKVTVKTNDRALIPTFPFEVDLRTLGESNFEWKLLRDSDCQGLLGSLVCITSGPLTIIGMGHACLVGVDRERRELIAFIGSAVDKQTYQKRLIPLFCELTTEA